MRYTASCSDMWVRMYWYNLHSASELRGAAGMQVAELQALFRAAEQQRAPDPGPRRDYTAASHPGHRPEADSVLHARGGGGSLHWHERGAGSAQTRALPIAPWPGALTGPPAHREHEDGQAQRGPQSHLTRSWSRDARAAPAYETWSAVHTARAEPCNGRMGHGVPQEAPSSRVADERGLEFGGLGGQGAQDWAPPDASWGGGVHRNPRRDFDSGTSTANFSEPARDMDMNADARWSSVRGGPGATALAASVEGSHLSRHAPPEGFRDTRLPPDHASRGTRSEAPGWRSSGGGRAVGFGPLDADACGPPPDSTRDNVLPMPPVGVWGANSVGDGGHHAHESGSALPASGRGGGDLRVRSDEHGMGFMGEPMRPPGGVLEAPMRGLGGGPMRPYGERAGTPVGRHDSGGRASAFPVYHADGTPPHSLPLPREPQPPREPWPGDAGDVRVPPPRDPPVMLPPLLDPVLLGAPLPLVFATGVTPLVPLEPVRHPDVHRYYAGQDASADPAIYPGLPPLCERFGCPPLGGPAPAVAPMRLREVRICIDNPPPPAAAPLSDSGPAAFEAGAGVAAGEPGFLGGEPGFLGGAAGFPSGPAAAGCYSGSWGLVAGEVGESVPLQGGGAYPLGFDACSYPTGSIQGSGSLEPGEHTHMMMPAYLPEGHRGHEAGPVHERPPADHGGFGGVRVGAQLRFGTPEGEAAIEESLAAWLRGKKERVSMQAVNQHLQLRRVAGGRPGVLRKFMEARPHLFRISTHKPTPDGLYGRNQFVEMAPGAATYPDPRPSPDSGSQRVVRTAACAPVPAATGGAQQKTTVALRGIQPGTRATDLVSALKGAGIPTTVHGIDFAYWKPPQPGRTTTSFYFNVAPAAAAAAAALVACHGVSLKLKGVRATWLEDTQGRAALLARYRGALVTASGGLNAHLLHPGEPAFFFCSPEEVAADPRAWRKRKARSPSGGPSQQVSPSRPNRRIKHDVGKATGAPAGLPCAVPVTVTPVLRPAAAPAELSAQERLLLPLFASSQPPGALVPPVAKLMTPAAKKAKLLAGNNKRRLAAKAVAELSVHERLLLPLADKWSVPAATASNLHGKRARLGPPVAGVNGKRAPIVWPGAGDEGGAAATASAGPAAAGPNPNPAAAQRSAAPAPEQHGSASADAQVAVVSGASVARAAATVQLAAGEAVSASGEPDKGSAAPASAAPATAAAALPAACGGSARAALPAGVQPSCPKPDTSAGTAVGSELGSTAPAAGVPARAARPPDPAAGPPDQAHAQPANRTATATPRSVPAQSEQAAVRAPDQALAGALSQSAAASPAAVPNETPANAPNQALAGREPPSAGVEGAGAVASAVGPAPNQAAGPAPKQAPAPGRAVRRARVTARRGKGRRSLVWQQDASPGPAGGAQAVAPSGPQGAAAGGAQAAPAGLGQGTSSPGSTQGAAARAVHAAGDAGGGGRASTSAAEPAGASRPAPRLGAADGQGGAKGAPPAQPSAAAAAAPAPLAAAAAGGEEKLAAVDKKAAAAGGLAAGGRAGVGGGTAVAGRAAGASGSVAGQRQAAPVPQAGDADEDFLRLPD